MIKQPPPKKESPQSKNSSTFSLLRVIFAATIILVPVIAVPRFFEGGEFPRQLWLLLLGSVLVLTWMIESIRRQSLEFIGGKKNLLWLVFLAAVGLSTLFSTSPNTSFFGGDVMNESLLSALGLIVIGFVATQWIGNRVKRLEQWVWLLSVANVLGLVAAAARVMNERTFGNTMVEQYLGSPSDDLTALLFAWMLPLALFIFVQYKGARKACGAALLVLNATALVLWATPSVWFIVSLGLFALLVLFWVHAREISRTWNTVVTSIFFMTILLWATPLGSVIDHTLDVRMDTQLSWQMAREAITAKPLLGFGPGMYQNVSARFLPAAVYNNVNSDLVFSKAGNEAATLVATMGLVTSLTFVVFIAWEGFALARFVTRKKTPASLRGHELLLLPLPMVLVSTLLFPFTTSLTAFALFFFVIGIAWYHVARNQSVSDLRLEHFPSLSFILSFLLGIVGVGVLALGFYGVQSTRASVFAYQGVIEENVDKKFEQSEKAKNLASWDSRYALLFIDASEKRLAESAEPENATSELLVYLEAQKETSDPLVARRVAESYTALSPLLDASFDSMLMTAWEDAVVRFTNHAGVRMAFADTLLARSVTTIGEEQTVNQEYLAKARTALDQAERLDPQNEKVAILRAKALVMEEKTPDAVALLQSFIQQNPRTQSARIALASIVESQDDNQRAVDLYTEVLTLDASNPVALVERARLLEEQGKLAEALTDTEKLLQIFPDNTDIQSQVKRLQTAITGQLSDVDTE